MAALLLPGLAGTGTFLGSAFLNTVVTNLAITAGTSLALSALTPTQKIESVGARLTNAKLTSSTEGQPISDIYGQFRVGGQLIWATRFKETVTTTTDSQGGKGGPKVETSTTTYNYSISFAVAFCEGEVDTLDKLYFDGQEVNLSQIDYSFYHGSATQLADPTIEAIEGSGNVPAYRGTCYLVFDSLPLADYGNRIPQVTATLTKSLSDTSTDLGTLIKDIARLGGIDPAKVDTSRLVGTDVSGYLGIGLGKPRQSLENLMEFYLIDVREVGGVLEFFFRKDATKVTIPISDIVVSDSNPTGIDILRRQPEEMLSQVLVSYVDSGREYNEASVPSQKVPNQPDNINTIAAPLVVGTSFAQNLANVILQEDYAARESIQFSLPLTYRTIQCGDVVELVVEDKSYSFKVTAREIGKELTLQAVGVSTTIYEDQTFADGEDIIKPDNTPTATTLEFLEFPLLPTETDLDFQPKIGVYQSPWFGGVNIYKEDGSGGHNLNTQVLFPATMGVTTEPFGKGVTHVWDDTNTLTVQLQNPADSLASLSDLSVLNGANLVAVLTPSGEYEMLQFSNATLNMDGTYTLSRLLRGRLGTEYYMGDPTPIGSTFVVVTPSRLGRLNIAEDQIEVQQDLRYGPFGSAISDPVYTDESYTPIGKYARPYAPVQLTKTLNGLDWDLSWVRRTRYSGDSWAQVEVPLNEETETYQIDILDGVTVVRTITVHDATTYTYTEADQITDFGSAQGTLDWNIYQISAKFGRGTPANG